MSTADLQSLPVAVADLTPHKEVLANNDEIAENNQLEVIQFSYWNPFSWLKSNDNSIEEIERRIFKSIKTPVKRFYVNIRNQSLKIWTISCNTESANLPIVLVHGYCGGVGLWVNIMEFYRMTIFTVLRFFHSPSNSTVCLSLSCLS